MGETGSKQKLVIMSAMEKHRPGKVDQKCREGAAVLSGRGGKGSCHWGGGIWAETGRKWGSELWRELRGGFQGTGGPVPKAQRPSVSKHVGGPARQPPGLKRCEQGGERKRGERKRDRSHRAWRAWETWVCTLREGVLATGSDLTPILPALPGQLLASLWE